MYYFFSRVRPKESLKKANSPPALYSLPLPPPSSRSNVLTTPPPSHHCLKYLQPPPDLGLRLGPSDALIGSECKILFGLVCAGRFDVHWLFLSANNSILTERWRAYENEWANN